MAQQQQRCFTFPLSHDEDTARTSPFEVRPDDAVRLNDSEGFRIIRKLLATQQTSTFCPTHQPATPADEATWLLHRDITHALILPILTIYRQAVRLGESLLRTRNTFDLELAFRGEARGAFAWLQCFIIEEEDWCATRGCPACIVTQTLHSEPSIRLILASCHLSPHLSSLPPLTFWLPALRAALDRDPFWGPAHYADIASRARTLEAGIHDLLRQCRQPGPVVRSPIPASSDEGGGLGLGLGLGRPGLGVRASGIAKRQVVLALEERDWMRKILLGCWGVLVVDAARARRGCEGTRGVLVAAGRARSLTS